MTETKYLLLAPGDSPAVPGMVLWPIEPGFKAIDALVRPLVGGGHIEHVTVLHDGQPRDMFVDEDGHARGLPRNDRATAIYRTAWLAQHPSTAPETLPHIVGTAVLFLRRVWF